jgi:uncharacterized OB-fold protein
MISPVKVWRNQKFVSRMVGKTGTIISWTIIRVPPADFGYQAPYPVVIVEFDNGERCTAQMVDYVETNLHVGQRVVTIVRRTIQPQADAVIPYGIKVKPIDL